MAKPLCCTGTFPKKIQLRIGDNMSKYWNNYPEVVKQLECVKDTIISINHSSEEYLNQSIDYLMATGGKMLRPAFLIIGSMFGDLTLGQKNKINTLAAAIETLHLATLIHDDIIDEANLRRGKETIQSKYSKEYAVYMGDFLFSQCFLMLAEEEVSTKILKYVSKGVARICKGEMLQNHLRYTSDIDVLDYLRIIKGKTATLFAVSLGAGAYEGGAGDKIARKIAMIGLNIGMAFQLIDDLLDFTGDFEATGKEVQVDILRGYYSLPLIIALHSNQKHEVQQLLNKQNLDKEDVGFLIELTKSSGAIKETQLLAKKYTDKALKGLKELPECSGKTILLDIVPKMLRRSY